MGEFILKNIVMTLDEKSITNAIKEINFLQASLKPALDALCEYLLEYGVTVARVNLMSFGAMRTGALYNSIKHGAFNRAEGVGYITAGEGLYAGGMASEGSPYPIMSYAIFVEYGTGVAGKNSRHPLAKAKKYNINKRKIYKRVKTSAGEQDVPIDGWTYFNERDNRFYFTQGQPAKPFMYNTYLDLIREAEQNGGRIVAQYIP